MRRSEKVEATLTAEEKEILQRLCGEAGCTDKAGGIFLWRINLDFMARGGGVKVFIAISVAVFAFSALFLKVERCQKDSGADYSHLWFVS